MNYQTSRPEEHIEILENYLKIALYLVTQEAGFHSPILRPARKHVSHFAAMNFDELVHGELETLLEEVGDFVIDVSRKISRGLRWTKICDLRTEEHTRELGSEVERLEDEAQKQRDELFDFTPSLRRPVLAERKRTILGLRSANQRTCEAQFSTTSGLNCGRAAVR